MNWSKSHLWSVASGWASTMSSMSSLGSAGGVGWGRVGLDVEVKEVSGRYFNWIGMDKGLSMEKDGFKCFTGFGSVQNSGELVWML